jgi:hypothetical protein
MAAASLSKYALVRVLLALILAIYCAGIGTHALQAAASTAVAARTQSVHETSKLHLVSTHGTAFDEEGQGSGTFVGSLRTHFVVYAAHATITYSLRTHHGTVSGSGNVSFNVEGNITYFNGTISISHGTGSYSHTSASGLHITGTLKRPSRATQIQVSGSMKA